MWQIRLLMLSAIAAVSAISANTKAVTSDPACLAASEFSDDELSRFKWLDTTTDTASVSRRSRWNLPTVTVSQITIVSDTTKCRRATNAYNSALLPDTVVSGSVYLFAYGPTRYVAVDTTRHAGEWLMHVVFDTSFASPLQVFRQ